MEFNESAPLGQAFYSNPYEFLQNYIRDLNNQIFLSQSHVNNLYALLLIQRGSPWDNLKTTSPNYKEQINTLIQKKVKCVKFQLDNMSQLYQEKTKKSNFNQIQRLMSILKAKNKSIYLQKPTHQNQIDQPHENNEKQSSQLKNLSQKKSGMANQQLLKQNTSTGQQQIHKITSQQNEFRWFDLLSNLKSLPNLSNVSLSNCLQYNSSQKYVKFKMMKNYIMTIKSDDITLYDITSNISKIPSYLFIHHIFPYLTSWQLFRSRSICKQWFNYVKNSWHQTFKRQMFIQLLAIEFYKDIEFFYKCIQLRNPFFQKISLFLRALIEIIQWNWVTEIVEENTISTPVKRVLLVFLKLLGENIKIQSFNDLTEQLWQQHKHKITDMRAKVGQFLSNSSGNSMSINQLRALRVNVLNHPFMRMDEMQTQQKTPLLILIFIKQLTLQQILKNNLYLSQQYVLNCKYRLDIFSNKIPYQKGFLQCVYKILLLQLHNVKQNQQSQDDQKFIPTFQQMLLAIFQNKQSNKPDFFIKTKNSKTNIYLDKAIKLEIILSTVSKSYQQCLHQQSNQSHINQQINQQNSINNKEKLQHTSINSQQINQQTNHKSLTLDQNKMQYQQNKNVNQHSKNKPTLNTNNNVQITEKQQTNIKQHPKQLN